MYHFASLWEIRYDRRFFFYLHPSGYRPRQEGPDGGPGASGSVDNGCDGGQGAGGALESSKKDIYILQILGDSHAGFESEGHVLQKMYAKIP